MGARLPPAEGFIIRPGDYTKVIEWFGVAVSILTYRVTLQENRQGKNLKCSWRRFGAAWLPYWEGSFQGSEKFHIYPGDFYLRIDLKPDLIEIGVTVTVSEDK